MEPLISDEETLGKKHRNFNKLVNDAIKNNPTQQVPAINSEEPDLDNLFKIDIACNNRDVAYILEVFKCDDMLYVSRAIKRSTWLITEQQYAHIINPVHLHKHLHPQMTSKAFNKLVLHIKLNLKDEKRVDEFFNYYKNDFKKALHWLPRCSVPVIEQFVCKHADDMPRYILKRLFQRSITILETLLANYSSYFKENLIEKGLFLLNRNSEKFLDIIEPLKTVDIPRFGRKYTKLVMDKHPERIKNNLAIYIDALNISVFAKYLKQEEIQDFILTHIKNKKTRDWFTYKKINYILNRLPFEERFPFVKKVFIEKSCKDENLEKDETWDDIVEYCNLPLKGKLSSSKNIYSWYVYAPFNKAFEDMQQLIRKESSPTERLWLLRTILTCAGRNQKNILTLIKYYHENHINEAFMYKVQFVNHLVSKTDTHRYDDEAWGYLNNLFNSLEVHTRSKDSVQQCVKSIVLYNIMHGKNVPETIENKFEFRYFISYQYEDSKHKFNTEEREKIFNYLYKYYVKEIKDDIKSETEFEENVGVVVKLLKILDKWNKELQDYPFIMQCIKHLIFIKKEASWSCNISDVYLNMKKSWRKLFFPESIILRPSQDSCINALKHDPELLEIYRQEINLCINDKEHNFGKFLKKIQIYRYRSLSDSFKVSLKENLNQISLHKSSIKGLCTLLSKEELLDFIQSHVPEDAKIDPSLQNDLVISIRKNIATSMHLSRPNPPLQVALMFAKGDYLKYVLPSLNAIFYNISSTQICEHVENLLNTPISLQKHGIRVAISKLNHSELKNMFSKIWISSTNKSIRKDIFCETFKKMCRENDDIVIVEMWEMLRMFIDTLTFKENKQIYLSLTNYQQVPFSIRPKFWMHSYRFFKNMPVREKNFINILMKNFDDIMEFLDVDLMEAIFFENFDKNFLTQAYCYISQISLYMLSTKSDSVQNERNEKILLPLIEKAVTVWNKQDKNVHHARNNILNIFTKMSEKFEDLVFNNGMVFPITMYTAVLEKLQSSLPIKENYFLFTYIKLSLGYMQIVFDDLKEKYNGDIEDTDLSKHKNTHTEEVADKFGRLCLEYLKEDVAKHFPSIYIIFAQVLSLFFEKYAGYNEIFQMQVLKTFLASNHFIQGYLLVTELLPNCNNWSREDNEKDFILYLLKEIKTHPSQEVAAHYWRVHNHHREL